MRLALYALAAVLAVAVLLAAGAWLDGGGGFEQPERRLVDERLRHPADIVRFKGRYVATELYDNRLAVFDNLKLDNLEHFDPGSIGRKFKSPHFLAVTPQGTLLISNAWGRSIVEIRDLEGGGWKEFEGLNERFKAPHGICVDDAGWIYVGDSLNSRLVRFQDMDGKGWEVFADVARHISYIRELECRDGAVWISNSYENRPGLNPGRGGNVLRISDFRSGRVEVVFEFPDTNITGLLPLGAEELLVGEWGARRRLALLNTRDQSLRELPRRDLGTPYGMFFDRGTGRVLVAHIGSLSEGEDENIGGIEVYRR